MIELLPCPFCGGEAQTYCVDTWWVSHACDCLGKYIGTKEHQTEAEAIAAWNTRVDYHGYEQAAIEAWESIKAWNSRAELGSKPPYDELLRCLENDWNIRASWDGLRKFWSIELTEEGVRLRDAELNSRAERTCKQEERGWGTEGDHARVWLTCGHDCMVPTVQDLPNYCPICGARRVGE